MTKKRVGSIASCRNSNLVMISEPKGEISIQTPNVYPAERKSERETEKGRGTKSSRNTLLLLLDLFSDCFSCLLEGLDLVLLDEEANEKGVGFVGHRWRWWCWFEVKERLNTGKGSSSLLHQPVRTSLGSQLGFREGSDKEMISRGCRSNTLELDD